MSAAQGATLPIAYSPCPNDTFVFHAWAHGLLDGAPALDVTFADIDVTNHWLVERRLPLMKISAAAVPLARTHGYTLLPAGGALGRGCGPLLLASTPVGPADLAGRTLAIPSELSTAWAVAQRWRDAELPAGFGDVVVMPFPSIMPAVAAGEVDAGLVIHEARFTYPDHGLHLVVDLGDWWESTSGLPLPLGAIVARDDLVAQYGVEALTGWLRASVQYAWEHPQASAAYVAAHADELSPEVQHQHIALYVNAFTAALGDEGVAAFDALLADPGDGTPGP
jgi:1,4-dihydroxy-6-naphthoate synthase